MAATVSIFPCRGKDEEGVSTPGFDRAGLQSERPKGACPPSNGRTVSDCGAYGTAELMAERKTLELGCARLFDLLRQFTASRAPTLFRCACERCPGPNAQIAGRRKMTMYLTFVPGQKIRTCYGQIRTCPRV
jgi:hypothetical protein